jgi:hypothetical protein
MSVRVSTVVLIAQPADKKLLAGLLRGETSSCAWSLCYFSSSALDVVAGARLLAGKVKSFLKTCGQKFCSAAPLTSDFLCQPYHPIATASGKIEKALFL